MPCSPADAVSEIKEVSKYISSVPGGMGCVRDVIEKVLKLNDHWELHTEIRSK
jgi:3-deoxy-D-manno-octulosonate 8-phosphate phosphatase (KDO 8-P phosphatase)